MKKTLLVVLLLIALATTAQAQGFRVYRSDGTVYQFSWVADSIAFYDGDGDPNYDEPVSDYVRRAIEELQAYCANNADAIKSLYDRVTNNAMMIQEMKVSLDQEVDVLYQRMQVSVNDLMERMNDNEQSIADLNAYSRTLANYLAEVQADLNNVKMNVHAILNKVDMHDEMI